MAYYLICTEHLALKIIVENMLLNYRRIETDLMICYHSLRCRLVTLQAGSVNIRSQIPIRSLNEVLQTLEFTIVSIQNEIAELGSLTRALTTSLNETEYGIRGCTGCFLRIGF